MTRYPGEPRPSRGGLFPIPHYSTRTRGGTNVSVGGCCLPIPIGCLTLVSAAAISASVVRRRLG